MLEAEQAVLPDQATYITPEDPSSEICGEVAAAFASAAIALRDTEPEYSEKLIEHSKQVRAWRHCPSHAGRLTTPAWL